MAPPLHLAALLHDVAKPPCTRIDAEGHVTAKGHSTKGANLARRILWRAGVPFAEREAVVGRVRHHQVPFWLREREAPEELLRAVSRTASCAALGLLAEADARGRRCADPDRILTNVALFLEAAREERCLDAPAPLPAPTRRPRAEVLVMSGFPGAGKDRWIAEHARDWPVVSLDALRAELGVPPEDEQGAVVQAARERARRHLRAGERFVWNATNLSRRVRGLCLRLLRAYDARVHLVYVEVPEPVLHAQTAPARRGRA